MCLYCSYNYEEVDSQGAHKMMQELQALAADSSKIIGTKMANRAVTLVDDFRYMDPIDGSISERQVSINHILTTF